MKTILALELSSPEAGGALFRGSGLLGSFVLRGKRSPSDHWWWDLQALFSEDGPAPSELDAIAVGTGPGSFAGIRSALAGALGLALPGNLPVLGYGSAFIIAVGLSSTHPGTPLAVVGDARRGRFWAARFDTPPAPANAAGDFVLCPPEELHRHLPADALVVTPEWERIGATLHERLPRHNVFPGPCYPDALTLGKLAAARPDLAQPRPQPIYIHPPTRPARR